MGGRSTGATIEGMDTVADTNHGTLGRAQWHVDASGELVCDGDGGHDMLRFGEELTNGIFHVEFCYTPATGTNRNYNSGVFIRNSADGTVWHQAQLTMTGGYLFSNSPSGDTNQRFKTTPTEVRMKPAGEWNTIEVTARGKVLRVWLNGAETCVYDQCEAPMGSSRWRESVTGSRSANSNTSGWIERGPGNCKSAKSMQRESFGFA